jgi:hypothetical protein
MRRGPEPGPLESTRASRVPRIERIARPATVVVRRADLAPRARTLVPAHRRNEAGARSSSAPAYELLWVGIPWRNEAGARSFSAPAYELLWVGIPPGRDPLAAYELLWVGIPT